VVPCSAFFWSFVNPLLLLGMVYHVQSCKYDVACEHRDPNRPQPYATITHVLLVMSGRGRGSASSLNEATGSLISGGNLIKKVAVSRRSAAKS
jgi:ABC-type polysaccharide/polyol phosphate export permease